MNQDQFFTVNQKQLLNIWEIPEVWSLRELEGVTEVEILQFSQELWLLQEKKKFHTHIKVNDQIARVKK